jgi:uncharacterized phage-like protein YoqJ
MWGIRVDETLRAIEREIKAKVPSVMRGGYEWHDITGLALGAEIKALRLAGRIVHHPVVHELVRFEGE